jgi:hypothetical protein
MTSSITILAGGWSASRFDLRKLPGTVIAVNDSAVYAPKVDLILSMDRIWAENRYEQVKKKGVPIWLRKSTVRNINVDENVTQFECDHTSTTLSGEPGRLNGTHSGFCALNLAYQLRPVAIYLVGFDMQLGPRGERHWHAAYPWKSGGGSSAGKLSEWGAQFKRASEQLLESGIITYHASDTRLKWSPFHMISKERLEGISPCAA